MDYLLPAAMSFTFMDSFNEFARSYILPAEDVDIQSVKDSYLAFVNLQREISLLSEQLSKLEVISNLEKERFSAERDRAVAVYLEAEFLLTHAKEQEEARRRALYKLEEELQEEEGRLKRIQEDIATAEQQIDSIRNTFVETEHGSLFLHLTQENLALAAEIDGLKQIGVSIDRAKLARCQNVENWLAQIELLPIPVEKRPIGELQQAVKQLAAAEEMSAIRDCMKLLVSAVAGVLRALDAGAKATIDKVDQLQQTRDGQQLILNAARAGMATDRVVLLTELNKRLPRRDRDLPAQALWQLCEVTDESWRPALEVVFGRKFAIVVDARDYDEAERIYHGLREETRGESLINPSQVPSATCQPGSLAEKLETKNPTARAVIDHLFGDVICVDRVADLRRYQRAILRDGFMAQRPFVQRLRHYDNRPCIGLRGLEKQRAWLAEQIENVDLELKQLWPVRSAVEGVRRFAERNRLSVESLHEDLEEAKRLPQLSLKFNNNAAALKRITTADLKTKQQELGAAEDQVKQLREAERGILRNTRRSQLQSHKDASKEATDERELREDKFNKTLAKEDVSCHAQRLEELRKEISEAYPQKDRAASQLFSIHMEAKTTAHTLRERLIAERKLLAAHSEYGSHYSDYDPECISNETYETRLVRIRDGEIREYAQKAKREELNWQQLFRTQVLEKLQQKLLETENLMDLLRTELREPIGYNRYRIVATPNRDKEYVVYRRLIEVASYAHEGELFFANADSELRDTIEHLFDELVKHPDSKEAMAFLDYRNYNDYDMLVEDMRELDQAPSSLNKHSGMFSGGENQAPFFVAILACYLRAYRRYEKRRRDPSLALVPIDEAFSKLSGECIDDCIGALQHLDLQGLFSMSTGNIPYAIDHCDQVIGVHKEIKIQGKKKIIRNIAVTLTRDAAYERFGYSGRK
ncbi:MAG TPA: SbcC/MukB-like Walker B domain-containing protein [Candidatus Angelobacter sp.]|nr:SbcC/MukB-like Walker B domain-containing protein [Candidatus Angelobacter sp.]